MAYFPFSAIVGQDSMKRALILAAIDPTIGGVLAFGDRGAGKSTAIRALAALMPPIERVDGCAFNCAPDDRRHLCSICQQPDKNGAVTIAESPAPVIDLPLGATEDRVVGALDLEWALVHGEKRFEPGLLAKAHRGFLYIDEVNLLEDHLVDVLLDVAASGENIVEREGFSIRHPARFVLVGSGNPEEGELRPQLLDRFGLSVDVRTPMDVKDRLEIIKRRDAFDRDQAAFMRKWKRKDNATRRKIGEAQVRLDGVHTPDHVLEMASTLCIALGADGVRGELTMMRAARAFAAFEDDDEVTQVHLKAITPLALRHRLRKDPLDETDAGVRVARAMDDIFGA